MIFINSEKIKIERANQCLTMDQLAQKSGVARNTIARIESQKVTPQLTTVGKIAKALGKKIEDFKNENTVNVL